MSQPPVCIIPARGSSKRFPGKNLAPFAGVPLLWRAIQTAVLTHLFQSLGDNRIWVNTDSRDIADSAVRAGALPFIRPSELALDHVQVAAVCAHHVEEMKLPSRTPVCIMLTTSPLTKQEDIHASFSRFNDEGAKVMHAVTRFEHPIERALRLESGHLAWVGGDPSVVDRGTQSFPPAYRITGSFTWVLAGHLVETRSYVDDRMLGYEVSRERAVDIDTPEDLRVAEVLWKELGRGA